MGEWDVGFNNLWMMFVFCYHEKLVVNKFQAIVVTSYILQSNVATD